jgi:hypothetical protein
MITVEKQDQIVGPNLPPQNPVLPRLHPTIELWGAIQNGNLRDEAILQSLAFYGIERNWEAVWIIADALKREVSLLFDNQGLVWVDVGERGMVRLSPPLGSRLPLRLWVHTHPWDAYWSSTDRRTLATVSGILEQALVLGNDHLVRSLHLDPLSRENMNRMLAIEGPLSHWTDEDSLTYLSIRNIQS